MKNQVINLEGQIIFEGTNADCKLYISIYCNPDEVTIIESRE